MAIWNAGATMGLCLFLGQAFSLKFIEEMEKSGSLNQGWKLVLSTTVLIVGWQVVQLAYIRGRNDASQPGGDAEEPAG